MVLPTPTGGSASDGTVIAMTDEAVHTVKRRFEKLSAEFDNVQKPLKNHYSDLMLGAGQFATELDKGAAPFLISWTGVFNVCSEDAGLIAGNTNKMSLDLDAIDRASSGSIQL